MAAKRFNSKIDAWIFAVLVVIVIVNIGVIISVALHPESPAATTGTILACIAATALVVSLMLRTFYSVERGVLRVVSGPFSWKIQIDEITSVSPSRSPLSSPALSMDRLLIRYGKRRRIMVSPADKQGFLRAIGHEYE
ncbi:MAG: PH domain-containing protein [Woeseiaceae bacterium]